MLASLWPQLQIVAECAEGLAAILALEGLRRSLTSRSRDPYIQWITASAGSVIVRVRAIQHMRRTDIGAMELAVEGSLEPLPVSQPFQYRFRGM